MNCLKTGPLVSLFLFPLFGAILNFLSLKHYTSSELHCFLSRTLSSTKIKKQRQLSSEFPVSFFLRLCTFKLNKSRGIFTGLSCSLGAVFTIFFFYSNEANSFILLHLIIPAKGMLITLMSRPNRYRENGKYRQLL